MFSPFRRRWRSIDHKLPLLASGLVLLTVVALGWTAYAQLERALVATTGRRLFTTASVVAQLLNRPTSRATDTAGQSVDRAIVAFASGRGSRAAAQAAVAHIQARADTQKIYGAFVDTLGVPVIVYHRPPIRTPRWPLEAIRRQQVRGDSVIVGPIESLFGRPAYSLVRALRDTVDGNARLVGYVVETRAIIGRSVRQLHGILGNGVEMVIGVPHAGVWTDLEKTVAAPDMLPVAGQTAASDRRVASAAHVGNTMWLVVLSQAKHEVLAPARALLWDVVPLGLAIALVSAALMWLMAHSITHPIVQLTASAETIAAESAADSLVPSASMAEEADEVTRLRFAFERMAERVASQHALEHQLRHAQKMEAVGRLAGGVAHDFNNMLTAIRSYADLLLEDLPVWDAKRSDVEEIRSAAMRAAGLTAQLLAFSRKQMLQPRVLDPHIVLNDVRAMLRRLLAEDIALTVDAPTGLWSVKVDRGQLEQVIVNLAVNARDAMPHGGELRITTRNETLTARIESRHGPVPTGEYVAIAVTDTGVGMDLMTQNRVFEPFFTTKAMGQGTGLGLATVHGIVAQSGGYVTVASAPAQGATFTVYLPRAFEAPTATGESDTRAAQGNNETILLVEDEQAVRILARRVLVRAGFRVLEATTSKDAVRIAHENAKDISLILTDVVMPELSGPKLVASIQDTCPGARVLYMSGYNDDEVIERGLENPGMHLLQKPFSAQQLVERVRAVLDEGREAGGGRREPGAVEDVA